MGPLRTLDLSSRLDLSILSSSPRLDSMLSVKKSSWRPFISDLSYFTRELHLIPNSHISFTTTCFAITEAVHMVLGLLLGQSPKIGLPIPFVCTPLGSLPAKITKRSAGTGSLAPVSLLGIRYIPFRYHRSRRVTVPQLHLIMYPTLYTPPLRFLSQGTAAQPCQIPSFSYLSWTSMTFYFLYCSISPYDVF